MKNKMLLKSIIAGIGLVSGLSMVSSAHAGGKCAEYRLSAYGGDAGFRVMNNPKDFRSTRNGSVVGKLCQNGHVKVELSKRHPGTRVSLVVSGREYVFGEGDRGDRHINNWFRRYVQVDLGRHKPGKKKWKTRDHNNYGHYDKHDEYAYDRGRGSGNHYGGVYYHDDNSYEKSYKNDHRYTDRNYDRDYFDNEDYYHKKHSNQHKLKHGHKRPRLAIHSKKHRKAHRRGIPHRHKRYQGHNHGHLAYN